MLRALSASPPTSRAPEIQPPEPGWLLICPTSGRAVLTLVVVGEADLATAHQLREALIAAATQAAGRQLVVDLGGLRFCDLCGMDALREGLAVVRAAGVEYALERASARLRWLLATFPEGCAGLPSGAGSDL